MGDERQVDWLTHARRLRDEGMKRATEHADRTHSNWSARAYAALLSYLLQAEGQFKCEDVRAWAKLDEPPDRRAWGSVLTKANKAGLIRRVGYAPHQDPSRHHGPSTVWRRA